MTATTTTIDDRLRLVESHQAALSRLISDDADSHSEWIATIAFYKAIQLVEAWFAVKGQNPSNSHSRRLARLRTADATIYKHFRPLYNASMVARYLCLPDENLGSTAIFKDFSSYMSQNVVDELIKKRLVSLETEVRKSLKRDFRPARW